MMAHNKPSSPFRFPATTKARSVFLLPPAFVLDTRRNSMHTEKKSFNSLPSGVKGCPQLLPGQLFPVQPLANVFFVCTASAVLLSSLSISAPSFIGTLYPFHLRPALSYLSSFGSIHLTTVFLFPLPVPLPPVTAFHNMSYSLFLLE